MVRTSGDDESERKVIDDIAEHGWHCVHILGDDEHARFSYTIGLFQTYAHPELVIFGLPPGVSHQILRIAADAAKSGSPLALDRPTLALLDNYSCCFAEVAFSQYRDHVGYARWYYEGNGFPLYQIVWPSRSGLFPWHPEASREFRAAQPVIAQAPLGTRVACTSPHLFHATQAHRIAAFPAGLSERHRDSGRSHAKQRHRDFHRSCESLRRDLRTPGRARPRAAPRRSLPCP